MKEMMIQEIQDISLEIMKHIDAFCKERHLTYFIDSGTLLGAARHKGFIPWDDDADIVMPRPDYDRFVKEYTDCEEYKLYSPDRHNCLLHYSRMCEMKRTYFKASLPWTTELPGVGVDIIPLDGLPNDVETFDSMVSQICKNRNRLWKLRTAIKPTLRVDDNTNILCVMKAILRFVRSLWFRVGFNYRVGRVLMNIAKINLSYDYESSPMCYYTAITADRRKFWKKEWFSSVVYLDFCDTKFPAPIDYESRLTAEYGDWRTPPPDKRITHGSVQTMLWR